jgi:hypothetical protein
MRYRVRWSGPPRNEPIERNVTKRYNQRAKSPVSHSSLADRCFLPDLAELSNVPSYGT